MLKIIIGTFAVLFYLFPTGILASGLVTEITVSSGNLAYGEFYKTKSFLLILVYTLIYFIVCILLYFFKEKLSFFVDILIERLFERGKMKELKTDIEEIKISLNNSGHLPKVVYGTSNFGKIVCVLMPSPLFVFGSITSIYYFEEGYEKLIGLGKVYNIQADLKIQVEVMKVIGDEGNQYIFDCLANNDNSKISKVIIKPNVSLEYINELK